MFTVAAPKFEIDQPVKLRQKLNFWLDKKTLGSFSKGHMFTVVKSHTSETHAQCLEIFEETGEITNPQFFYDLIDKDGREIMAYEDDLKRVKIASTLPEDQDEEDEEAMAERQTSSKLQERIGRFVGKGPKNLKAGKPTLVHSRIEF